MSRRLKMVLPLILSLVIIAIGCPIVSANAVALEESGMMNLDVVFVIDASGSMHTADPQKVTVDAFNLFTDFCDSTCSVGYVVYTEKIKEFQPVTPLDSEANIQKIKEQLNKIQYDTNGDTDISLGVSKAMELLEQVSSPNDGREQAIILLSDGNTHLIAGAPRTEKESKAEMQENLTKLKAENIPVFAIGLNYDGTMGTEELKGIADGSGWPAHAQTDIRKFFEINNADQTTGIMRSIVNNYIPVEPQPFSADLDFHVSNKSIYAIYIMIDTKVPQKELDPRLTSPGGTYVSLDSPNIKMTSTKSYTMIKIFSPEVGKWNLKLSKVTNENCQISLATVYTMYVKQEVTRPSLTGEKATITASLNNGDEPVSDMDLLDTLQMKATVSGAIEPKEILLKNNGKGVFTGEFITSNAGEYSVVTKATSSDKKLDKTSEEYVFSVVDPNAKLSLHQALSSNKITLDQPVTVTVTTKNVDTGKPIIVQDTVFTTTVKGDNGFAESLPLKQVSDTEYAAEINFSEKGRYTFTTTAVENGTDKKTVSNDSLLDVTRTSFQLMTTEPIEVKVVSPPVSSSADVILSDKMVFDAEDTFLIKYEPAECDYYTITETLSGDEKKLTVQGVNSGYGETKVILTNQYGEAQTILLKVTVDNGLLPFFIIGGIVLGVAVIIFILYMLLRAKLSGNVKVHISMPSALIHLQPPDTGSMRLPHGHKTNLKAVYDFNRSLMGVNAHLNALSQAGILKEVSRITITACSGRSLKMKYNGKQQINSFRTEIPAPKGGNIRIEITKLR